MDYNIDIWGLVCEFANYRTTVALSRTNIYFHNGLKNKVTNYLKNCLFNVSSEGKVLAKNERVLITFKDNKYHIYNRVLGETIDNQVVTTADAKRNNLYINSLHSSHKDLSFIHNLDCDIVDQIMNLSYWSSPKEKKVSSSYFTVGFGYLANKNHKEIGINLDPYYRILIDNVYNDIYEYAKEGKKFHILSHKLSEEDIKYLTININVNNLSENIKIIKEVKKYHYDFVQLDEMNSHLYGKLHNSPYHPHIISSSFDEAVDISIDFSTTAFIYYDYYTISVHYKSVDFSKHWSSLDKLLGVMSIFANQYHNFQLPYLLCPACRVDKTMKDISFLRAMIDCCNKTGGAWLYMSKIIENHISQI